MTPRNQALRGTVLKVSKFILAVSLAVPTMSVAQTDMTIYADSLVNGWSDGSYIALNHSSLTTTGFASISFWLNGGSIGGQQLRMHGVLGTRRRPGLITA
jgi:hypothetical protein